jgi:hypothetical protein
LGGFDRSRWIRAAFTPADDPPGMSTTSLPTTTTTAAKRIERPAFTRTRRAVIRLQAAHVTRQVINELIAQPEPRYGRPPTHVRLDALTARYAALGGEPADLLAQRRTFGHGGAFRRLGQALQARHDEWTRRELDAAQTARAHRHEIGGDFSVLP